MLEIKNTVMKLKTAFNELICRLCTLKNESESPKTETSETEMRREKKEEWKN